MIGVLTAVVMLVTGWCLCETRHQMRALRERDAEPDSLPELG